jgi:hypothetical protein
MSISSLASISTRLTQRRVGLLAGLFLLVLVATFAGATKAEEQDGFCASCHTPPEQAYVDRAQIVRGMQAGSIVDLATAHVGERSSFGCIDCHRGDQDLNDRGRTLLLGARDAVIFVSGRADGRSEKGAASEPDLLNRACFICHIKSLTGGGFNNHFHNLLASARTLQNPQNTPSNDAPQRESTIACVDCHRAHVRTPSGQDGKFMDTIGVVYPACVSCHRQVGQGPLDLSQ